MRPDRDGRVIPRMLRRNIWLILTGPRVSGARGCKAPASDARCGADPAHGRYTPGLRTERSTVQSAQGHN
jgi:hypothetical protein